MDPNTLIATVSACKQKLFIFIIIEKKKKKGNKSIHVCTLIAGNLRNIRKLKPWDLHSVFVDKYNWNSFDAREITEFLEPMLCYDANLRATAAQWLV